MSADNYYEINPEQLADGSFRFGVNMGFESDEHEGPLVNGERTAWFDTFDKAVDFVEGEYAEYGYDIVRNAAWEAYQGERAAARAEVLAAEVQAAVSAERARCVALLRRLADGRADYIHPEDERSDNYGIRQTFLLLSSEVGAMRTAADVLESGSVEEVQGWLPSWRWTDKELIELGLDISALRG